MRTINFQTVLNNALRQMGWDPTVATDAQKARVAASVGVHLGRAWDYDFWPELTCIEERAYANDWSAAITFGEGDVVWDPTTRLYYTSLENANTGNAVTDTDWWAATDLKDLESYVVAWEQRGKTRIGEVLGVYPTQLDAWNDQSRGAGRRLAKALTGDGLQLLDAIVTQMDPVTNAPQLVTGLKTVWVRFRKQAPRFTTNLWNEGGVYAEGEVVLWPTSNNDQQGGECYRATLSVDNAWGWEKQEIPLMFEKFLQIAVLEDVLAFEQHRQANYEIADDELFRVNKVQMNQQGLVQRSRFQGCY